MAVITDLAEALVAELNAVTFSRPFTAARYYLPRFELADLQTLQVSVVPKGVVLATGDRTRSQGDYSLDVAVQQKFASDANAELDPLTNLVEEIVDHFRGRRLDSYPDAAWLKTEQTVLYAPEHLTEFRQFTSLLTFTYRVLR